MLLTTLVQAALADPGAQHRLDRELRRVEITATSSATLDLLAFLAGGRIDALDRHPRPWG
jgi:hypothetical protein